MDAIINFIFSTWIGGLILGAYLFGLLERVFEYKVFNPKASEEPQYWRWVKTILFPLPTLWRWVDLLIRKIKGGGK